MSSLLALPPNHHSLLLLPQHRSRPGLLLSSRRQHPRWCCSKSSKADVNEKPSSQSENLVLKLAWYSSELLGIAASFFRPAAEKRDSGLSEEVIMECLDRTQVVETIKEDFVRSYFVTGNLTVDAYEEDCEFTDPAGSFKGLRRFKRNCTNFGSLLEKSDMKLIKWEDFEEKGVGHWRFSCVMVFPWKPILSATGYTEYYLDAQTGKVCRHIEHWNVPKMALLKQILKPSRNASDNRS